MLPRRWTMLMALGIALASLLIVTASLAASGTSPAIYAYLNSDFVYGYTSSGGAPVTVTLANASGLKTQVVITSSTDVSTTGLYGTSLPVVIRANDVLTVTSSVDSPILMTVPNITARANRATNTLAGTAPANSPLRVTLEQPGVTYEQFVTSTAGGDYSATFAPAIQAGDWGTVTFTPTVAPTNTVTHLLYRTPLLRFYLGSNQLDGYTVGGDLPLTLTLSNGALLNTTSSHNSFSYGKFALNTPNNLQVGTRVTMTAGTEAPLVATIQALTVNMDPAHNALNGIGPGPDMPVWVEYDPGQQTFTRIVTTSHTAPYTYTAIFTASMSPGDWGRASVSDGNGNLTYAYARLPVVYVYEGNRHIFGYAAAPNLPVTVTLKNGATVVATAGSLVSSQNVYSWGFFSADLRNALTNAPVTIRPGYTVVVTVGTNSVMTAPVVSLTGQVDTINDTVTGSTLSNSNLQVTLYRWNGNDFSGDFTQNGAADASGNYAVSFTSVYSAQLGDYALVYRPDGVTGVVYAFAPSTHPTLSVINPLNVPANTPVPITSTIGGGVHVTYANVHWDTVSRSASYAYNHSTPIQSGDIGSYTSIITGVQLGQVFFRARAFVDGQELWSEPEQGVQVGRAVYLPLIWR